MIAALAMYDRAETAAANDALWDLIRDNLRGTGVVAPDHLSRGLDPWDVWLHPDLVLAQTCGFPFRARLQRKVNLVGTPDYGITGLQAGFYQSVILVRSGATGAQPADYCQGTLAFNEPMSQSGWAVWQEFNIKFGKLLESGGHAFSAQAVAEGHADITAVDAKTWQDIARYDSDLAGRLREIGRTAPTPGLPFITSNQNDPATIAAAVTAALADLPQPHRATLGIEALVQISEDDYLAQPIPPSPEQR